MMLLCLLCLPMALFSSSFLIIQDGSLKVSPIRVLKAVAYSPQAPLSSQGELRTTITPPPKITAQWSRTETTTVFKRWRKSYFIAAR
jgi:hypothetical protein